MSSLVRQKDLYPFPGIVTEIKWDKVYRHSHWPCFLVYAIVPFAFLFPEKDLYSPLAAWPRGTGRQLCQPRVVSYQEFCAERKLTVQPQQLRGPLSQACFQNWLRAPQRSRATRKGKGGLSPSVEPSHDIGPAPPPCWRRPPEDRDGRGSAMGKTRRQPRARICLNSLTLCFLVSPYGWQQG